jgi:dCTP diphosphatase
VGLQLGSADTCTVKFDERSQRASGIKLQSRAHKLNMTGNVEDSTSADASVAESVGTKRKACPSSSPTLESLRESMAEFAKEREWDQFHTPRNLLLAMVGEVGELSELFQWRGEVESKLRGWSDKDKVRVGEEMSDVLLYLVRMADVCGIDLGAAATRKMALNAEKYPAQLVKGRSKKYCDYTAEERANAEGSGGSQSQDSAKQPQ